MNHSGALYRLIQSLTQSEKRYFHIVVNAHRDSSDYLKLFKAIDEKEGYDDERVKALLKDQPFIRHLAVKKIHLYQLLLRSLRNFHGGKTFDFSLKEMMTEASILSDKALYKDSYAMVMKAKKLAQQFEDWKVLLEIVHKEYILIPYVTNPVNVEKEFQRIPLEEKRIVRELNNYGEIANLAMVFQLSMKKSAQGKKASIHALRKLMMAPVMKKDTNAISFRAKSLFYIIQTSYCLQGNQLKKAERFLTKHIQLYQKFPHFIEASPGNYLSALSELLRLRFKMKRFEQAWKIVDQMRRLPETKIRKFKSRKFRSVLLSFTLPFELAMSIQDGMVREILARRSEDEDYFLKHTHLMELRSRFETLLALASCYFEINNNKRASHALQKIFKDKDVNRFGRILEAAQILQIILYLEDGELDTADHLVAIVRKEQKQEGVTAKRLAVELVRELIKTKANDGKRKIFVDYLRKFEALQKKSTEQSFFEFFDITRWINRKIS